MRAQINPALLAAAASLMIILLGGCASSAGGPSASASSAGPSGAISVQQVPMTPYMRSQIGTPNELSPLAPGNARNIRKVGGQWLCELNGQTYIFNGADWVPK
jgi:hypothetical protein